MLNPGVIYKNKDFLVLNKPAGLLVHRSVLNREELNPKEKTLTDWLVKKYPQIKNVGDDTRNRPGIAHRLDKETSGVMLAALNQKTFEYLKKLFQNHEIKKTYLALVYGNIKSDRFLIDKPIGIKSGTIRRSVHSAKMSKEAVTEFEVIKRLKILARTDMPAHAGEKNQDLTLLRAYPKTGRTHQIRVHLASIYCPVVGDKLYGRKKELFPELDRQFLHAESIEFPAPQCEARSASRPANTGRGSPEAAGGKATRVKTLKFKATLPKELSSFLKSAE